MQLSTCQQHKPPLLQKDQMKSKMKETPEEHTIVDKYVGHGNQGVSTRFVTKSNGEEFWEQKKKIDALEEDKKAGEIIEKSNADSAQAQEVINDIKYVKSDDAKLTTEQVKKELDGIVDPKEKKKRESQIKLAKEIKENADKKRAEIEKDEKFNVGDDISFRG
jgi:hypothetical protein